MAKRECLHTFKYSHYEYFLSMVDMPHIDTDCSLLALRSGAQAVNSHRGVKPNDLQSKTSLTLGNSLRCQRLSLPSGK